MNTSFLDITISTEGVQGSITVGTTPVPAQVGMSPLANRQVVTVQHKGSGRLFWGYSSSVTASTGTELFRDQFATFEISLPLQVWLVSDTAGQQVRITEAN